jgi:hypothetical protein
MFVFKSWKESILSAETIHQEEENKLRLSNEHPHSYYMSDTVLQAGRSSFIYFTTLLLIKLSISSLLEYY